MVSTTVADVQSNLERAIQPLTGTASDLDSLLELIGDSRFVLLGEATHGTHEFYKFRGQLTRRLVREKGFTVIAWEADWPDALRVNRYIRGQGPDATAVDALGGFKRFPAWMWRNADILDLIGWLRAHNEHRRGRTVQAGIYGLDLYSLHTSMEAVIRYLEKVDPAAAGAARRRYACFEDFGEDEQAYGMVAGRHQSLSCEDEVVQQLVELQSKAAEFLSRDGRMAADELFFAEQNARVAKNAEQYYRAMYQGRPNTWNLRDTHMVDTLELLMAHLETQGEEPKAILWAHNSHLGDARATQMHERGELNIGQLVREHHGEQAFLLGFTTYTGTVTAASDWGGAAERKSVRPGLRGSYELLFHELATPNFLLTIRDRPELAREWTTPLLERAIGVIYRPETERWSHYFDARLAEQFDAVVHFDETRAVEPLERTAEWVQGEVTETFPRGV